MKNVKNKKYNDEKNNRITLQKKENSELKDLTTETVQNKTLREN